VDDLLGVARLQGVPVRGRLLLLLLLSGGTGKKKEKEKRKNKQPVPPESLVEPGRDGGGHDREFVPRDTLYTNHPVCLALHFDLARHDMVKLE